jgi:hypothetical protein
LKFREHNGLYHGEALETPRVEVIAGLLARGVVNEFPRGVAEPEEWPAIFVLKEMTAGMNLDARELRGRGFDWLRRAHSAKGLGSHCSQTCSKKLTSIHDAELSYWDVSRRLEHQGCTAQVTR